MDGGDFVVVVNAAKVKLSGRKVEQKRYFSHSGYMGHESFTPVASLLERAPEVPEETARVARASLSQFAASAPNSTRCC